LNVQAEVVGKKRSLGCAAPLMLGSTNNNTLFLLLIWLWCAFQESR
tara:strand:- start:160 stop:297 length:138 start_codon:yes stop_codon:yes gene_type:complete